MTPRSLASTQKRFEERYRRHPLWQYFYDAAVEKDYQTSFEQENRQSIIISAIVSVIVYPAFGVLDYLIDENYQTLWLYRGLIGWIPLVLLCLVVVCGRCHGRYQSCAFGAALFSGAAILLMLLQGGTAVQQHYPYGLIVVVLFGTMPFFLRFVWVLALTVLLLAGFVCTALMREAEGVDRLAQGFLISCSLLLATGGAFYIERFFRGSYLAQHLKTALVAAEAAAHAKNDFIAVVSHELKTPLTVIKGNGEILRDEIFGPYHDNPALYRDLSAALCENADHLLQIIHELLDISKAQAGKLDLDYGQFDLVAEARRVTAHMQAYTPAPPFTLTCATELPLLMVTADQRRIRQALLNLVSNAIKFNRPGGAITVTLARDGDTVTCLVQDQGIGIAPEDQERIFTPFEQAGAALSRRYDGTGLGLPFVRQVILAHGGTLHLTSAVGEGTTIGFSLPLGHPEECDKAAVISEDRR
jgi:two-component system cell cycle sensor histidine kinase PleC